MEFRGRRLLRVEPIAQKRLGQHGEHGGRASKTRPAHPDLHPWQNGAAGSGTGTRT